MAFEDASDTTYSMHYSRARDRFTLFDTQSTFAPDVARLPLGDEGDFILFDNTQPGVVNFITHRGRSAMAINILAKTIFCPSYPIVCESVRDGATIYDFNEQEGEFLVPFSAKGRLARIALHAASPYAGEETICLHQRILSQKNDNLATSDDGGGGAQQP